MEVGGALRSQSTPLMPQFFSNSTKPHYPTPPPVPPTEDRVLRCLWRTFLIQATSGHCGDSSVAAEESREISFGLQFQRIYRSLRQGHRGSSDRLRGRDSCWRLCELSLSVVSHMVMVDRKFHLKQTGCNPERPVTNDTSQPAMPHSVERFYGLSKQCHQLGTKCPHT